MADWGSDKEYPTWRTSVQKPQWGFRLWKSAQAGKTLTKRCMHWYLDKNVVQVPGSEPGTNTSQKVHVHPPLCAYCLEKLPVRVGVFQHCDVLWLNLHVNRPHVAICMWVWLVDVGHVRSWTHSIPTLSPYFFHQFISTFSPRKVYELKSSCYSHVVRVF